MAVVTDDFWAQFNGPLSSYVVVYAKTETGEPMTLKVPLGGEVTVPANITIIAREDFLAIGGEEAD